MDKLFVKDFLSKYLSQEVFSQEDAINKFKNEFLPKYFDEGKFIYKFYAFSSDQSLNKSKIKCLKRAEIWCAPFYAFDDKTEFYVNCDIGKVSQKTGYTVQWINEFLDIVRELNDLASFTFSIKEVIYYGSRTSAREKRLFLYGIELHRRWQTPNKVDTHGTCHQR